MIPSKKISDEKAVAMNIHSYIFSFVLYILKPAGPFPGPPPPFSFLFQRYKSLRFHQFLPVDAEQPADELLNLSLGLAVRVHEQRP